MSRPLDLHKYFPYQRPSNAALDEVYAENGEVIPYWNRLLQTLEGINPALLEQKKAKALRILRDDGATYNIYSELTDFASTWSLDLIPNVLSSEEWASIEAGLLERAELFNLFLKDIYGPRNLVKHGILPPESLFAHSGFLRPCDGIQLQGDHQLILHGVDMVRDTQRGGMCVISDRTQNPSGIGYALENRTVMSRVLPSLYRESHVHRLANFFHRFRTKLTSLSPNPEQARIVMLTPGALNESYFEHAYIANYLGFHLVRNGDLVVRNGYLWMKSFGGLNRVDVIVRRVDDSYCDPVELRGDSLLGVPGLLEPVRAGRVVIANPLGAGILENPIYLKYLPAISKALIGRELRLPSVATYWCNDPKDMSYIRSNFSKLVIKPTFRGGGEISIYAGCLSTEEQASLLARIEANKIGYVAQPILDTSHLPTYGEKEITSRPAILRSFTTASDSSYTVMPGGLTRVGVEESQFFISNQVGSQSKDTWVIESEPLALQTQVQTSTQISRDADRISLPSRVAENLFWMGRYAERAEASLRLLRTVFIMFNGEEPLSLQCKKILLSAVTNVTNTFPGFVDADESIINDPIEHLLSVVTDGKRRGSVRSDLNAMLYCADESREQVSSDTLRVINDIRDALTELDHTFDDNAITAPEEALDPLVTALMALSGLSHESMVRGVGWRFMEIGRRLERAHRTNSVINHILSDSVQEQDEGIMITAVLLCLENLISYRRRYSANLSVPTCLDMVMLDTSNPRSLLFQLESLLNHLNALPKAQTNTNELLPAEQIALEAQVLIKMSSLSDLSQEQSSQRPNLKEKLMRLNELINSLSDLITDRYFDHREDARQLVKKSWADNE